MKIEPFFVSCFLTRILRSCSWHARVQCWMLRRKARQDSPEDPHFTQALRPQDIRRQRRFVFGGLFLILLFFIKLDQIVLEVEIFFQALDFVACDVYRAEPISLPRVYVLNGRSADSYQSIYETNKKFVDLVVVSPSREQSNFLTDHALEFTCVPCPEISGARLTAIYANMFAYMLDT